MIRLLYIKRYTKITIIISLIYVLMLALLMCVDSLYLETFVFIPFYSF